MDKSEASKVAIVSIANYSWNLQAYDPQKTWVEPISRIYPTMKDAYMLFSVHNTDPGPSYHQYRRIESATISTILDRLTSVMQEGKIKALTTAEASMLKQEF